MNDLHPNHRPWTAADVPPGPYFHGTMFEAEPGAAFDLTVPRTYAPEAEWGIVNNQPAELDERIMFWATTDRTAALAWGARYGWRLEKQLDQIFVWEVELDSPEVDVNQHNRWNTSPGDIVNVMGASGRFLRLVDQMPLADYWASQRRT